MADDEENVDPVDTEDDQYSLGEKEIPALVQSKLECENREQIYPGQQYLAQMIVEKHIVPILRLHHKKELSYFQDVDFQVTTHLFM